MNRHTVLAAAIADLHLSGPIATDLPDELAPFAIVQVNQLDGTVEVALCRDAEDVNEAVWASVAMEHLLCVNLDTGQRFAMVVQLVPLGPDHPLS
jgi:hypothetical protein